MVDGRKPRVILARKSFKYALLIKNVDSKCISLGHVHIIIGVGGLRSVAKSMRVLHEHIQGWHSVLYTLPAISLNMKIGSFILSE